MPANGGRHLDRAARFRGAQARFGLRLAFPTAESCGAWELTELDREERAAEAEESGGWSTSAAARPGAADPGGVYKPADVEPREETGTGDTALQRFLPRLAELSWDRTDGTVELGTGGGAGVQRGRELSRPSDRHLGARDPNAPGKPSPPSWRRSTAWGATDQEAEAPRFSSRAARASPRSGLLLDVDAFKRCGYRLRRTGPGRRGRGSCRRLRRTGSRLRTRRGGRPGGRQLPDPGGGRPARASTVRRAGARQRRARSARMERPPRLGAPGGRSPAGAAHRVRAC